MLHISNTFADLFDTISLCKFKRGYLDLHTLLVYVGIPPCRKVVPFLFNMNNHKYLALVLGLTFSITSLANTEDRLEHFLSLSFEELVSMETSIATATSQSISKSPAVVSLITQDDIKATGATNLVDILQSVPGIHVRTSSFANRPLVHFRGAKASQTLLMVNGTPMKDLMWGFGIFWKGLPTSIIDRIEIIRGPGSALFGADASAGVINVITKTAGTITESEAGARIGSFDSKTAWLQYGEQTDGFDINLTAEIFETDGHDPYIPSDGQTRQDQNFNTNVSLTPDNAEYGWRSEDIRLSIAKENWRMHADYMRHSDLQIGLTGAGVLDHVTEAKDSRYNLDFFYNNDAFSNSRGKQIPWAVQQC